MQRHEAEEHLRVIRSLMEKSTIYRAISAPTALVGGASASLVGLLFLTVFKAHAGDPFIFFGAWAAVLAVTGVANTWFVRQDAIRRGDRFISPGMKMALWALAPSHLTAAFATVLAAVLTRNFAVQNVYQVLPALWSVLYGLGLLATAHFAPHSLRKLGWCFLLFGLAATGWWFTPAEFHFGLEGGQMSHAVMAFSFGLFHLIYAACTWPRATAENGGAA
jgi:hypothetical protein